MSGAEATTTCSGCGAANDTGVENCFRCGLGLFVLSEGAVLAGRYEIQRTLGKGGMGVVYRAHDRELDETVAVKVLRPDVAGAPGMASRFRSEIKLARRVTHRNVCRIHDYGRDGPLTYIVMEYVDGRELRRVVRDDGALPPAQAYRVGRQIAEGLQAIHDVGIVHRDLKTANVMLDRADQVKLMDFGIAKSYDSDTSIGSATMAGLIVGTPEYMSPEQARGEKVDARSDVYALGVILFELFSGELPFRGDTPVATLWMHMQEPPPLDGVLSERMPAPLIPVLKRALAKSRDDRFASARTLDEALSAAAAVALPATRPPAVPVDTPTERTPVPESTATETTPRPVPPPAKPRPPLTPAPRVATAPRPAPRPEAARAPWVSGVGAGLLVLAAIGVAVVVLTRNRAAEAPGEPVPTPAATISAAPPATAPETSPGPSPTAAPTAAAVAGEPRIRVDATVTNPPRPSPSAATAPTPPTLPVVTPPAVEARRTPTPVPTVAARETPSPAATPAPGRLQLHVVPWAEVSVDGVAVGTTPFAPLALPPGPHTLRLAHPSYQTVTKRVTIQSHETTLLKVDLTFEAFPKVEDRK